MHLRISHIQLNGVDISVFVSFIRTGVPAKKPDDCHLLRVAVVVITKVGASNVAVMAIQIHG